MPQDHRYLWPSTSPLPRTSGLGLPLVTLRPSTLSATGSGGKTAPKESSKPRRPPSSFESSFPTKTIGPMPIASPEWLAWRRIPLSEFLPATRTQFQQYLNSLLNGSQTSLTLTASTSLQTALMHFQPSLRKHSTSQPLTSKHSTSMTSYTCQHFGVGSTRFIAMFSSMNARTYHLSSIRCCPDCKNGVLGLLELEIATRPSTDSAAPLRTR